MWPSSDLADIATRRLEVRGHPFPHRHLRYEGAGHLIVVPYIPTTTRVVGLAVEGAEHLQLVQGGTPRADAEAGIDAWAETLRFLEAARAARERA